QRRRPRRPTRWVCRTPAWSPTLGVVGPGLWQVQPGADGPGDGALGVVAVDGHLTVGLLAQRAAVLVLHADGAFALLGEAGVVEDQGGGAFGAQPQHGA